MKSSRRVVETKETENKYYRTNEKEFDEDEEELTTDTSDEEPEEIRNPMFPSL